MALVACAICRQPFYASCHDSTCLDAICPFCEYGDDTGDEVPTRDEPDEAPTLGVAAKQRAAS